MSNNNKDPFVQNISSKSLKSVKSKRPAAPKQTTLFGQDPFKEENTDFPDILELNLFIKLEDDIVYLTNDESEVEIIYQNPLNSTFLDDYNDVPIRLGKWEIIIDGERWTFYLWESDFNLRFAKKGVQIEVDMLEQYPVKYEGRIEIILQELAYQRTINGRQ